MKPALATRESRLIVPTGSVLQCILGGLLGDACLDHRPTNPRLTFNHGQPQEAYARHKAHVLRDYVLTPPKLVPNRGYGSTSCTFRTVTTPVFDFLRPLCLRLVDGRLRKAVTSEWVSLLSWEGVAYWFMDDGSLTARAAHISTHSFTRAEVESLAGWFAERDVATVVDEVTTPAGRRCWLLRFNKESTRRLVANIAPFIPECMAYKAIPPAAVPTLACCICGKQRTGKAPSGGKSGPLCGATACTRARNAQNRYRRLGKAGKECEHCGVPLVDMGMKKLCDGCRARERVRQIRKKRSDYVPVPTAARECFWCGAQFRAKGGTAGKHPSCGARECSVHARRLRRNPNYVRKPVTWFRVPEEAFLSRRARSKEVA